MKIEVASTLRSRLLGLLGRESLEGALLLVPCNDVHTFGMRRAIDIAFLARDGTVLESHRCVGPNRRVRNRRARAVLERFSDAAPWCEPGDSVQHDLDFDLTCVNAKGDERRGAGR